MRQDGPKKDVESFKYRKAALAKNVIFRYGQTILFKSWELSRRAQDAQAGSREAFEEL